MAGNRSGLLITLAARHWKQLSRAQLSSILSLVLHCKRGIELNNYRCPPLVKFELKLVNCSRGIAFFFFWRRLATIAIEAVPLLPYKFFSPAPSVDDRQAPAFSARVPPVMSDRTCRTTPHAHPPWLG